MPPPWSGNGPSSCSVLVVIAGNQVAAETAFPGWNLGKDPVVEDTVAEWSRGLGWLATICRHTKPVANLFLIQRCLGRHVLSAGLQPGRRRGGIGVVHVDSRTIGPGWSIRGSRRRAGGRPGPGYRDLLGRVLSCGPPGDWRGRNASPRAIARAGKAQAGSRCRPGPRG